MIKLTVPCLLLLLLGCGPDWSKTNMPDSNSPQAILKMTCAECCAHRSGSIGLHVNAYIRQSGGTLGGSINVNNVDAYYRVARKIECPQCEE